MLLGVWGSDIAAYAVGRLFGRRQLAAQISPAKTVEGFLAGLVAGDAIVFFTLYHEPHGDPLSPLHALELGVAVAVAAPIGDLFESYLKRDMGVKDTGSLLGAHGGMLDRVDALLLAAPGRLLRRARHRPGMKHWRQAPVFHAWPHGSPRIRA